MKYLLFPCLIAATAMTMTMAGDSADTESPGASSTVSR